MNGFDVWWVGGWMVCVGFGVGIDGGDMGLWGRMVCFLDCKGVCCLLGRVWLFWVFWYYGWVCLNCGLCC